MGEIFAFFLPTMMASFGIAFLIVSRWRMRAAAWWSAGFFCIGAAFAVTLGRTDSHGALWSILSDLLFATGFLMFSQALLERWRPSWLLLPRIGIWGLSVLTCTLAVHFDKLILELVICNFTSFLLIGLPLIAARAHLRNVSDRTLFCAAALVALDSLVSGGAVGFTLSNMSSSDLAASDYATLMQALAFVFGLFLALAALAAHMVDLLARYQREAMVDPLSGLLNRRGFDEAIAHLGPDHGRDGSLIVCDIDHFKAVNDEFGHAMGDQVIVVLAEIFGKVAPAHALTARFGGEEFMLFLPDTNAAHAAGIADQVREGFTQAVASRLGLARPLTASFGLSTIQRGDGSILDAIARADSALYDAKARGRNRICVRRALSSPETAPPRILSA
ncbi:MAG TPA: GGDEF domain-containing protein [Sphingobium sp.]